MKTKTENYIDLKTFNLKKQIADIKKSVKSYEKRINDGIVFLNKRFPKKSWLEKIDIKKLNLQSNQNCVWGQLCNGDPWSYVCESNQKKKGQITRAEIKKYGFTETGRIDRYDLLTAVWYDTITKLKAKANSK